MGSLDGKVALITGASRGLGRALAKQLSKEGATLILIAQKTRDLEILDDECDGETILIPMDVQNFQGFYEIAENLNKRFKCLDVLIGNAGILGNLMPVTHMAPILWHRILDVNFHANWHILRAFETLLKRSPSSSSIFISDSIWLESPPYWGAYAASKAALEVMIECYSQENFGSTHRVHLVDPGPMRTKLRASAMPGEDEKESVNPEDLVSFFVRLIAGEEDVSKLIYRRQKGSLSFE